MSDASHSDAGTDSVTVGTGLSETTYRTADDFADPDADVVICTEDHVQFHVHRWILSKASGLFSTMFSLKRHDQHADATQLPERIELPEDSVLVNSLLRFIYPLPSAPVDSIENLSLFLDVAVKYDVSSAIDTLRRLMLHHRFLHAPPPAALTLYSIAIRYSFPEVAAEALKCAISRPLLPLVCVPSQLRFITGEEYHYLLRSQRARADAAREVVAHSDLQSGNMLTWMCDVCAVHGCSWWKIYKDAVWRALGDEPTSQTLWNKTIIEQCLFRGCEKRYFYFGRAVELGYFDSLKKSIDDLAWQAS